MHRSIWAGSALRPYHDPQGFRTAMRVNTNVINMTPRTTGMSWRRRLPTNTARAVEDRPIGSQLLPAVRPLAAPERPSDQTAGRYSYIFWSAAPSGHDDR